MNEATAVSLGDKLATLDLTDDETALLGVLLGGIPQRDVEGFAFDIEENQLNYEEIKVTYAPIVGRRFAPNLGLW